MVYFDQAATSYPKPERVIRAVSEALLQGGNPGHGGHRLAMEGAERLYRARETAARFFKAEPEQVVFTPSCTVALNMAIKGIMAGGGHLLISDSDHNASLRPASALVWAGKCRAEAFLVVEGNPEKTLSGLRAKIRPDTRAVVCTHASNVTGNVLPVEGIRALCKEKGILFILDAAQTAGLLPVRAEMADVLCIPGHKGLLGPMGTGMMIVGKGIFLPTILEGGTGTASLEPGMPEESPERFEPGTVNFPGIMGLAAGIEEVEKRGMEAVYRQELETAALFYRGAREIPGVRLHSLPPVYGKSVPTVSFTIGDAGSAETSERLSQEGFMLRGGYHCAGLIHRRLKTERTGTVRFSCGAGTGKREVLRFLEIVQKIAREG